MRIETDKVFELFVAALMRRNGYRVGTPGLKLPGRGTSHQIDAIGIYPFAAPFTFPIRLISEAKCYRPSQSSRKIGVDVVRNLQAIVTDLEQTLPAHRKLRLAEDWEENLSCSYHGALFATLPFSDDAIAFANSYGLDMVVLGSDLLGRDDPVSLFEGLRDGLLTCIQRRSPAFREKHGNRYAEAIWDELEAADTYGVLPVDSPARKLVLDLVEFIVAECSGRPPCGDLMISGLLPLREAFSQSRFGSIDGHVVVFSIDDDGFQSLRRFTTRRFYERSTHEEGGGGVRDPFYPSPDSPQGEGQQDERVGGAYDPVSMEHLGLDRSNDAEGPSGGGRADTGIGDIHRIEFYLSSDRPGGSSMGRVRARAAVSRDLLDGLRRAERPRKVVIPVDFGCFYYGLLR